MSGMFLRFIIFFGIPILILVWLWIENRRSVAEAKNKVQLEIEQHGGLQVRVDNDWHFGDRGFVRVRATYIDKLDQPYAHRIHLMLNTWGMVDEIVWITPLDIDQYQASKVGEPIVRSSKEQIISDLSAENDQLRARLNELEKKTTS